VQVVQFPRGISSEDVWMTPLRARGKRYTEREAARHRISLDLHKRAEYRCEGCGIRDQDASHLDWHHLGGSRGTGLGLGDWADSLELAALLCHDDPRNGHVGCHTIAHNDPKGALRYRLLREAGERLRLRAGNHCTAESLRAEIDPADAIRMLVRRLEETGVDPWSVEWRP
jgi:hypothetical protein